MKKYLQLTLSFLVLAGFSAYGMNNQEESKKNDRKALIEQKIAEDQCIICLEGLKDTKNRKLLIDLPCGHVFHRGCLAEQLIGEHAEENLLNEVKNKKFNTQCGLCKVEFSPFSLLGKDYFKMHEEYQNNLALKKFEAANKDAQIRLITRNNKYIKKLMEIGTSNLAWELLEDICLLCVFSNNLPSKDAPVKRIGALVINISPWIYLFYQNMLKTTSPEQRNSKINRYLRICSSIGIRLIIRTNAINN